MNKEAPHVKWKGGLHFNRTERLRNKYGLNNRFRPFDLPGLSTALARRSSPLNSLGEPYVGHRIVNEAEQKRIKRLEEILEIK